MTGQIPCSGGGFVLPPCLARLIWRVGHPTPVGWMCCWAFGKEDLEHLPAGEHSVLTIPHGYCTGFGLSAWTRQWESWLWAVSSQIPSCFSWSSTWLWLAASVGNVWGVPCFPARSSLPVLEGSL